ncbi:MAG: MBL fold metallo-hydrolase [Beijerinckiaceae bacterium]
MSGTAKLEHDTTRLAPGELQQISALVRRLVAPNGSPFTFTGTCSYIVGAGNVAVIDPGPADDAHIQTLLQTLHGETVDHIVVTHTHRDHSPGARALQKATGAKILGCSAHVPVENAPSGRLDASHDTDHSPDVQMHDGDILSGRGYTLEAITTPGHASNHLCFALREENTLFSGDHVMAWSTSIVAPPDGSMHDYMRSLDKVLSRQETTYLPGHGAAVREPQAYVAGLAAHRRQREAAIAARIAAGDRTIPALVASIYVGLDTKLHAAAGLSVLAHLEDMTARGIVKTDGAATLTSEYRPA